jgi:Rad3-related DNA helicase
LLEGPTGTGKTLIALVIALYLAATRGWKTRITVPNLYLENQYVREFQHLGLVQPIPQNTTTVQPCGKCNLGYLYQRKYCQGCPYLKARDAYARAPVAVTNLAYALTCARHGQDLGPCDLQVINEIHGLESIVCGLYELKVPLTDQNPGEELEWLRETFIPETQARIEDLKDLAHDKDVQERITKLEEQRTNAEALLVSEEPPIITRDSRQLIFQPVSGRLFAPRHLDTIAPRRLMMSATILHAGMHLYYLGLDRPQDKNRQQILTSPFPAEYRLLRPWPVLKWRKVRPITGLPKCITPSVRN